MQTTRPIRVLNIIARLNIGGPAVHVALITQHLNPPDHPDYDSALAAGSIGPGEGDMRYAALDRGVIPIEIPSLGRELHPLRDLRTLWALYRLIRRFQPDVMATHTAKAGFVGRAAAWLARTPVIVHTFHGHVFAGYFSPARTRLFLTLERLMARISDTLIVLTPGQRDELAHAYRLAPEDRFTVMPLGLDLADLLRAPRHPGTFRGRFDIAPDVPLATIVGRLVPVKNHALFLEAAARVHAALPAAHFAIVGDGELRAELEQQAAALRLSEAVTFTGWLTDMPPVYADSDVLVISSVNEGTPVTVIEALAAGCPVAATAVGGLPDLLRQGEWGALSPSGDADALAEAMLEILRQPQDMTARRAQVAASFGIDRLTRDLDTLYRELLYKKGRVPGG